MAMVIMQLILPVYSYNDEISHYDDRMVGRMKQSINEDKKMIQSEYRISNYKQSSAPSWHSHSSYSVPNTKSSVEMINKYDTVRNIRKRGIQTKNPNDMQSERWLQKEQQKNKQDKNMGGKVKQVEELEIGNLDNIDKPSNQKNPDKSSAQGKGVIGVDLNNNAQVGKGVNLNVPGEPPKEEKVNENGKVNTGANPNALNGSDAIIETSEPSIIATLNPIATTPIPSNSPSIQKYPSNHQTNSPIIQIDSTTLQIQLPTSQPIVQSQYSSEIPTPYPSHHSSDITIGVGVLLEYAPNNKTQSDIVHQDYIAVDAIMSTLISIIDKEDFFHIIPIKSNDRQHRRRYIKSMTNEKQLFADFQIKNEAKKNGHHNTHNTNHHKIRKLIDLAHIFEFSTFHLSEKFNTPENKHFHVIEVHSVFRILDFDIGYEDSSSNNNNEDNRLLQEGDNTLTANNIDFLVNRLVTQTIDDGSFLQLVRVRDPHILSLSDIQNSSTLKSIITGTLENRPLIDPFHTLRLVGIIMFFGLVVLTYQLFSKAKKRFESSDVEDKLDSNDEMPKATFGFRKDLDSVLNPEGMILKLNIDPQENNFELLGSMLSWQNPDKAID